MKWKENIMKSKTSFFNKTIYKKNLTRFVAFPLLYFAFLFISMHIPAYKAQHMSMSVIISFFINAETKFVHK